MDKTQEMLELWCSAPGVTFKNPESEEAYEMRARRIADATQLKVPDRVPISPSFGIFPALDNGFTSEECMFDYNKTYTAWMKTLADFEPDTFRLPNRPGTVWVRSFAASPRTLAGSSSGRRSDARLAFAHEGRSLG